MATILPEIFDHQLLSPTLKRCSMLTVRKEVEAYVAACERLLKLEFPLNDFEQRVLNFYLAELTHKAPPDRIEAKL